MVHGVRLSCTSLVPLLYLYTSLLYSFTDVLCCERHNVMDPIHYQSTTVITRMRSTYNV